MNLIEFPEQTVIIDKDQPEYLPLPAFQFANDPSGRITCCWKLTWRERLRLLFTGKIWHTVLTFHQSLQPQMLELKKPFTPADVLATTAEKRASESRRNFEQDIVKRYGAKAAERMRHFDALNYHANDRRRCLRVDPVDYERCREHGVLFIGGCRIVNDQYKSAA